MAGLYILGIEILPGPFSSGSRSLLELGCYCLSSLLIEVLVDGVCQGLVCGVRTLDGISLWRHLLTSSLPLCCGLKYQDEAVVSIYNSSLARR